MVAKQDKRDREDGGDDAPLDELGIETRGEPVTFRDGVRDRVAENPE